MPSPPGGVVVASLPDRVGPVSGTPSRFRMRWVDLLFMHWPVPADALRPLIPPGLELDTFEGRAWLGVVPFGMQDVAPRFLPAPPGPGAFPELNVRTYVRRRGGAACGS